MSKSTTTGGQKWTADRIYAYDMEAADFGTVLAKDINASIAAACKAQADETKRCIEMVGGLGNRQEVPMAQIMENEARATAGMARLRERKK